MAVAVAVVEVGGGRKGKLRLEVEEDGIPTTAFLFSLTPTNKVLFFCFINYFVYKLTEKI